MTIPDYPQRIVYSISGKTYIILWGYGRKDGVFVTYHLLSCIKFFHCFQRRQILI